MHKSNQKVAQIDSLVIKALTALVGPLSLSVWWENGPGRGLKTAHHEKNAYTILTPLNPTFI